MNPWLNYSKETLPRGLSYVVGRDLIEAALREAGATLGWLSIWHAVPSELRQLLRTEVVDRWLPEACAWAAGPSSCACADSNTIPMARGRRVCRPAG